MDKVFKAINKDIRKLKIAYSKLKTSIGLKLVTRQHQKPFVKIQTDISYGKNKLQKYDLIYPTNKTGNLPVIFYAHGGSWCGGDKYGYNDYLSKFAQQGYICVNINYRLVPKVSMRVVVLDCIRAIKHFEQSNKIFLDDKNYICADLNKTFMIGDSAGAHLVSLVAGKLTSGKLNLNIKIKALGLYYGVYDFNNLQIDPSPILNEFYEYLKISTKNLPKLCKEISPTTYVTKNYPPCFITSGKVDKLNYQSNIFEKLLSYNNIEHDYLCFEKNRRDGVHAFLNLPKLKSSKEAYERLTIFFDKQRNKWKWLKKMT